MGGHLPTYSVRKMAHFVNIRPPGGFYRSSDVTLVMEDFSQVLPDPVQIGRRGNGSYGADAHLLGAAGRLGRCWLAKTLVTDWHGLGNNCRLPPTRRHALVRADSTGPPIGGRGCPAWHGKWTTLRGSDGCRTERAPLAWAKGFDNDLWIRDQGRGRDRQKSRRREYQLFAPANWGPRRLCAGTIASGRRVGLNSAQDGWVGKSSATNLITLRKKAAYLRELDDWGFKRLGLVHKLYWSGDQDGWGLREISDNDGGQTSHYGTAMAFNVMPLQGDEAGPQEIGRCLQGDMVGGRDINA